MNQPTRNVLFVHYGDQKIRGSERVLLDLIGNFPIDSVRPILWTNVKDLVVAARRQGIKCYEDKFYLYFDYTSDQFKVWNYLKLIAKGLRLSKAEKIDIIHSNNLGPCQWMSVVSLITAIPLVAHVHASYLRRSRLVLLAHFVDRLVGVSSSVVENFNSDRFPQLKARVIKNGLNFERLDRSVDPIYSADLTVPDKLVVGAAGELTFIKGFDVLVEAIRLLDDNYVAVIAGSGEDRAALQKLIDDKGLTERVRLAGHVDKMGAFYRSLDIFVVPSRQEAFGLVAAEAGYFELPVVASNVGGLPEVVRHDESGLLVSPGSITELAKALGRLGECEECRVQMGKMGKAIAVHDYSVSNMIREFSDIYTLTIKYKTSRIQKMVQLGNAINRLFVSRVVRHGGD